MTLQAHLAQCVGGCSWIKIRNQNPPRPLLRPLQLHTAVDPRLHQISVVPRLFHQALLAHQLHNMPHYLQHIQDLVAPQQALVPRLPITPYHPNIHCLVPLREVLPLLVHQLRNTVMHPLLNIRCLVPPQQVQALPVPRNIRCLVPRHLDRLCLHPVDEQGVCPMGVVNVSGSLTERVDTMAHLMPFENKLHPLLEFTLHHLQVCVCVCVCVCEASGMLKYDQCHVS